MVVEKRSTLSLPGLIKSDEDGPLHLSTYDIILPCREFDIDHKVAVLGRVSLTAEFLLRLLKSADGLDEASTAGFFGFDLRDMSFVLSEVENAGYVERRDGKLWLTFAGMSLFRPGSDQPQIFAVEALRESYGFDLLSFAPEKRRYLEEFDLYLPELSIRPEDMANAGSRKIPSAFRRFYYELQPRRERKRDENKSLYSIDNVVPRDRFPTVVRVMVRSTGMRPFTGEPDLSDWRNEMELDDRVDTIRAASAFVESLLVNRHSSDADAYAVLLELAPEFLKDFTRKDGLAIERYYREAIVRSGEARSDRRTLPIVGASLTRENMRRAGSILAYGLRHEAKPTYLCWLTPMVRHWGATRALPEFLKQLKNQVKDHQQDTSAVTPKTVCVAAGRPESHLEKAFDVMATHDTPKFPRNLELLVVPGVMTVVTVHALIGAQHGLPVPLGFASFDPGIVERAQAYITGHLEPYLEGRDFKARIMESLAIKGAPTDGCDLESSMVSRTS